MNISINGVRKNMFNEFKDILKSIKPLIASYKSGDYEPSLDRFEAERLFEKINVLRTSICILMCVSNKRVGMSDLSDLTEDLGWIEYENQEE